MLPKVHGDCNMHKLLPRCRLLQVQTPLPASRRGLAFSAVFPVSSAGFSTAYYRYAFVLDLFNNVAAMVAFIKSLFHDKISFVFFVLFTLFVF